MGGQRGRAHVDGAGVGHVNGTRTEWHGKEKRLGEKVAGEKTSHPTRNPRLYKVSTRYGRGRCILIFCVFRLGNPLDFHLSKRPQGP